MLPTTQYYFYSASNYIDFSMYPDFEPKRLLAVINTTVDQTIIYNTGGGSASPTKGIFSGTPGNYQLTLAYSTSSMSETDSLELIYDESVGTEEAKASIDIVSGRAGLDCNLLNSSFGGTLDDVLPAPFSDNALSVAILNGGVLSAPAMNVNNELIVDATQSGDVPVAVTGVVSTDLNSYAGNAISITTPFPATPTNPATGAFQSFGAGATDDNTQRVVSNLNDTITFAGPISLTAINTNLLTGTVNGWYDVKSFRMASVQTIGVGTITVGTLIFEQTNDNTNTAGIAVPYVISGNNLGNVGSTTFAYSANNIYDVPLTARYFRLRLAAAVTGGGYIKAIVNFNQSPYTPVKVNVVQPTAATLATTVSGTVTSTVTGATLGTATTTDIASAAVTTTVTSANIALTNAQTAAFQVIVTASSGTSPVLDVVIQETFNTTDFHDIYHFPRITGVGQYQTPLLRLSGVGYRVVRTVAGTTPSFTMSLVRVSRQASSALNKMFINRTIDPNGAASSTPSFFTDGCDKLHLCVSMNGGGSGTPTFKLQGSEDQLLWYDLGTNTVAVAPSSAGVAIYSGYLPKYTRAQVVTTGSGTTLSQVCIKGNG